MSPAGPESRRGVTCWDCGAANWPGAAECWLCQRRDWWSDGGPAPKATALPDDGRSRLPVTMSIVVGAVLILCLGMSLDIWQRPGWWGPALLFATLAVPVVLIIVARARGGPRRGKTTTTRELTAAVSTIAASVMILMWLAQALGPVAVAMGFGLLAVPAVAITGVRAWRRHDRGLPMSGVQLAASVMFLAVLLPALLLTSLVVAGFLICLATGSPSFH